MPGSVPGTSDSRTDLLGTLYVEDIRNVTYLHDRLL